MTDSEGPTMRGTLKMEFLIKQSLADLEGTIYCI